MRGKQDASIKGSIRLDPLELAAILDEVRRAVLAVDEATGEHQPLRDIRLTRADSLPPPSA
jgi:hypothetical protein